ncbi:hypothetical protein BDZ89DRAFT_1142537 [Hymenopellis radicata]|nr:hypothetical protein BDZ89DRAFT_1142537 [Hymenopellis radicata]
MLVTLDNVNAQGFWEAAVDASSVDGNDLGFKVRTAILDTGTTLMILDDSLSTTTAATAMENVPAMMVWPSATTAVPGLQQRRRYSSLQSPLPCGDGVLLTTCQHRIDGRYGDHRAL